jgi:hypothetical protein
MKLLSVFILVFLSGCANSPVRATVDSYGDAGTLRATPLSFEVTNSTATEKKVAKECEKAAFAAGLKVYPEPCAECSQIVVYARVIGTKEVINASPLYTSPGGNFGDERAIGTGLIEGENVRAQTQSVREMTLVISHEGTHGKPIRQILITSSGKQNSVDAVAYEMCKAAFMEYPENLKQKLYQVDAAKNQ